MTQQIIGIGTYPNDGTGDAIRTAMTKINGNFTDLYSVVNTTSSSVIVGNNVVVGNSTTNVVIAWNATDLSLTEVAGDQNNYVQSLIWNNNTGTSSSADFIVYDNLGPSGNNYIDIGINSGTWSNSLWTINGPSDSYVYASNTNLSIGTANSNYINFFVGGTLATNEVMRISANGNVGVGTNAPQQTLSVNGSVSVTTLIGGSNSATQTAVIGYSNTSFGIQGISNSGVGVRGLSNTAAGGSFQSNASAGVIGISLGGSAGGNFQSNTGAGVIGSSSAAGAGGNFQSNTGLGGLFVSNTGIGISVQSYTNTIAKFTNTASTVGTLDNLGNFIVSGSVNAASFQVGSIDVINSTGISTSSNTLTLGTSNVAHTTALANGYSRIPNGLLMQWGTFPTVNTTAQVVTFATATGSAFTTNAFSVVASSNSGTSSVGVYAINATAFTVVSNSIVASTITWQAIGI